MTERPKVRVRTARGKDTALTQYEDLLRAGNVAKAVVIVEHPDGNLTVLGQYLTPQEMAPMLGGAAVGVSHAMSALNEARPERHAPAGGPIESVTGPALKQRMMVTAPDGRISAPAGEVMAWCAECNHPRWYATMTPGDDLSPARLSCAYCGNEIVFRHIHSEPGNA